MSRIPLVAALSVGCLQELPDLADPCVQWPDPGLYKHKIDTPKDGNRKSWVYVPPGEGPRDVVVLLHGGDENGPDIADVTGFPQLAHDDRFVLVYPNGLGWPARHWDAGPNQFGDADDVTFLDELLADLKPRVCGANVFATGFSNGAMMAQRWACQTSEPIQAVGVSSGPLMLSSCDGPPLPIHAYHGLDDTVVPPKGGKGLSGVVYPSEEDAFRLWEKRNLCSDAEPTITEDGDVTCRDWDCAVPTEMCFIKGWEHVWPGGIHAKQAGINATTALWDFFRSTEDEPPGF